MGQRESSISEDDLQYIDSNHPQFNKIRLINTNQSKLLQADFPVHNASDIKQWEQKYKSLQVKECLLLPIQHQLQSQSICGSSGNCKITYPYFQYLLSDYIAKFNIHDNIYENEKIWYLILVLLEAADVFHSRGEKIGDVRPVNVFLNHQQNIKIANHFSWPHQLTNYEKSIFNKEVTYLAPEQLKQLNFGHSQPKSINFSITESFSIGLTLLDRVMLTDSSDLYNLNSFRFQYQKLGKRIEQMNKLTHIQGTLKEVIEGLCKIDPKERLRCGSVYDWLKPYRIDILQKSKFQFQYYPQFIKNGHRSKRTQTIKLPKHMYEQSQVVSQFPGKLLLKQEHSYPHKYQQAENIFIPQKNQILKMQMQGPLRLQKQIFPFPENQFFVPKPQKNLQEFNWTLKKIQQQLQRSRRLFPS